MVEKKDKENNDKPTNIFPAGKLCQDLNAIGTNSQTHNRYICDGKNCAAITMAKPSRTQFSCGNCKAKHDKGKLIINL